MKILILNTKKIYAVVFMIILTSILTFEIICQTSANNTGGVPVPIIMYHSVLQDKSKMCDYIVNVQQFQSDLDYLLSHGYTPILSKNLINYVDGRDTLPEKPVIITFDDGFYNNKEYIFPIIKEKNVPIIISVVGSYSDCYTKSGEKSPAYGYLRYSDISELSKSGLVEFGNHTYNFHTIEKNRVGCTKSRLESRDEYEKIFLEDVLKTSKMLFEQTGKIPTAFTYPFGKYCEESEELVKKLEFRVSYSCNEGMNYITKDPECLFLLKRYNRPARYTTEQFMKRANIL